MIKAYIIVGIIFLISFSYGLIAGSSKLKTKEERERDDKDQYEWINNYNKKIKERGLFR